MCHTNADLDPLISEVNSEGKVTVTVKHGGWVRYNNILHGHPPIDSSPIFWHSMDSK